MESQKSKICTQCQRALSFNSHKNKYECLGCIFRHLPDTERIDFEAYKLKKEPSLREEIEFDSFYDSMKRSASDIYLTRLLICINLFYFFCCIYASGNTSEFPVFVLDELGGSRGSSVFGGESWRLITSMFLHGGLVHFIMNMLALWVLGGFMERILGSFSFLIVYFCSGIIGGMFSLYSHTSSIIGVGASGAIAGLFGGLVVYAYFRKMPKRISKNILSNAILMIIINVAIGISIPQVDNSAHLGGLITGAVLTYFIAEDIDDFVRWKRGLKAIVCLLICAALVTVSCSAIAKINEENIDSLSLELMNLADEIDSVERISEIKIDQLINSYENGDLSKEETLKYMDEKYIDPFRKKGLALIRYLIKKNAEEEQIREVMVVYAEKAIKMQLEYLKTKRKYVETSNPAYLTKAKKLKQVLETMRPSNFE